MKETKDEEIQDQTDAHETSPNLFKMKRTRTKLWEHIMLIAPTNEKNMGIQRRCWSVVLKV